MSVEKTFCRFCPALCGLVITTSGDTVIDVQGDRDDPLSRGYSCEKGRDLGRWHHSPRRLEHPMLRVGGRLQEASWEEVIGDLGRRLRRIAGESGPDAVGAYAATGSAFDGAGTRMLQRWLGAIGSTSRYTSGSIDAPAKALVSQLLTGQHWLVPTMDYERTTLAVFIGTNPLISHGHFNGLTNPVDLIRRVKARGEVWVIDPRRTETAKLATRHLSPRPGTDHAILAWLVRELLLDGADRAYLADHATGVDQVAAAVLPYGLDRTASITGLTEPELEDLLSAVRRHGRLSGQTGTGVTMSAQANATEWLLWCLHAVTGSFERPGGVWFNPGYLRQLDRRDWAPGPQGGADPKPMPSRPDLPRRFGENPTAALPDEILAGNLRGLIIAGGNPTRAVPDPARMMTALGRLDVFAVADVREIEVIELASHVLPVTGQLERADLSYFVDQFLPQTAARYTPAVLEPVAERRPLWWVFAALGETMDLNLLPEGVTLDSATDDDLLRPIGDRGRGGSFDSLRAARVESAEANFGWVEKRLLPARRYQLGQPDIAAQLAALRQPVGLILIPRRQRRHLNSQLSEFQSGHGPHDSPDLILSPADARERGLAEGASVLVTSAGGELRAMVRIDPGMRRGAVSLPHGWEEVNVEALLTTAGADRLTGMPRMSGVAVEVTAAAPPAG